MSDEIQQIKDKIDVAELVGEYVQLKPAGVNKKGLCPFHQEKTPSFMVNSERRSWHCFGCSRGGDIFTFIEEMEGLEFKEALKYLSDRAGVQLMSGYRSEAASSQKNRIKEINQEAARFFHNFLLKMDAAKDAREYLRGRGLRDEIMEEWQLGFIPEQWDLLTQYLLKKGFGIDDLAASGLTIQRDKGPEMNSGYASRRFWDRFRGRIMFPIWNVHDEAVGFTGRILVEKENSGGQSDSNQFAPGKYLNTPQTPVYDKSRVIYGLNKAKQAIRAKDLIVMVEGQMDAIAVSQTGMKNVVASSGTALTEEQVKLLKRYAQNLNMSFDMDEAGQNAAKRGIEVALRAGLNVKVIRLPENAGKDPDECIKKNARVWETAVSQAQDVMQWYFEKIMAGKNLADHKQKQQVVNALLPEIALIPYAVERDHWLKVLGDKLGVETSVLREDLNQIKKVGIRNKELGIKEEKQAVIQKGRFELLTERLLSLLLKFPGLAVDSVEKLFAGTDYAGLYNKIKNGYNKDELVKPGEKQDLADVLLLQGDWEFPNISEAEAKKELENIVGLLRGAWVKKRRHELQIEIEKAEKAGDTLKVKLLLGEFEETR